jgi:hypothetical protein
VVEIVLAFVSLTTGCTVATRCLIAFSLQPKRLSSYGADKKIDSKVPWPSATIPGKVIAAASPCQYPA